MATVKISLKMAEEIRYAAERGFQGTMSYANTRTEDALLRRGLVTYDHNIKDADGDILPHPVITVAGWAMLKAAYGTERPADEGRLSLDEAREEAHSVAVEHMDQDGCGAMDASDLDACGQCEDCDGRYPLDAALAEAYTPRGQVTCEHGRGLADTCDGCPDVDGLISIPHPYGGAAAVVSVATSAPAAGDRYAGELLRLGVFKGVPVPGYIQDVWDGELGIMWRSGVRHAQEAARKSFSAALPPIQGDPAYPCPVCKWKFTTWIGLRRHSESHA